VQFYLTSAAFGNCADVWRGEGAFPSLQRRGGRAIKNGPVQKRRGRGGRFGEIFRPKHFAELTTPSAALRSLRDF